MCELTFANLHDPVLNRTYLYLQMLQNSSKVHKDGFGIFSDKGLYKSALSFQDVVNQKDFLGKMIVDNNPVMGHCRHATGVWGKVIVIDENNSHPFENDKLVLMHNGMLEYRVKADYDKYKDVTVDTQLFLNELTEIYDGKNFAGALKQAMDKFYGVFCFIIYSKLENRWFAVRGSKRILHYTSIYEEDKLIGYVVNTELEDMRTTVKRFCNIASLMTGKNYTKEKDDWFMSENSIFELTGKSVKHIGTIIEKEKPVYVPEKFPADKENNKVTALATFMLSTGITFQEVDQMLVALYGEGLLSIGDANLTAFIKALPEIKKSFSVKKKKIWNKILYSVDYNTLDGYEVTKLQCPYFMNSKQELITALNKLKLMMTEQEIKDIGELEPDIEKDDEEEVPVKDFIPE